MSERLRMLNVGGAKIAAPAKYADWDVDVLDIDPLVEPDICLDAREIATLAPNQYDAVYCSHMLEHLHEHEVGIVLRGFCHVLRPDGFADIRVPDALAILSAMFRRGLELDGAIYQSPSGPIRVADALWGFQRQIRLSGQDYYAHRWGFSRRLLGSTLKASGFSYVLLGGGSYDLMALAFQEKPSEARLHDIGIGHET
jgi:hypothetical protein